MRYYLSLFAFCIIASGVWAAENMPSATESELRLREMIAVGSYREGYKLAGEFVARYPQNAALSVARGELAGLIGKLDEAEAYYKEALQKDSDNLRARVLLKELYDLVGRSDDSSLLLDYIWDYNNTVLAKGRAKNPALGFLYVARAAAGYNTAATKVAFRHFVRAYKARPSLLEAYLGAGELALSLRDLNRARRSFELCLKQSPNNADAHLGLARTYMENGNYKKAEASANTALGINKNLVGAHLTLATLKILDNQYLEATSDVKRALEVNKVNPHAMTFSAVLKFALGDEKGFERETKQIFELYPKLTDVYTLAAGVMEQKRRLPEALELYKLAIALDKDSKSALYGLGMSYVRMGEERAGHKILSRAFELNPFNVQAFNMLSALDRDILDNALTHLETEHWYIKVDRQIAEVMGAELMVVLERLWDEETSRFGFVPKGPSECNGKLLFEMFNDHDDFSVRTVGLPNLGALGATLGQIVTMPSPMYGLQRKRPFNWVEVIRHELAHVITLQMTDYKIPRWFTEGVSVYVDKETNAGWDEILALAASEGELAPLRSIDTFFTRPNKPSDVAVGYYQASLVVDYIVRRYGFNAIVRACELYGKGLGTPKVMQKITSRSLEELDFEVKIHIERYLKSVRASSPPGPVEIASLQKQTDDPNALTRLAEGLLSGGAVRPARRILTRVIEKHNSRAPAAAFTTLGLIKWMNDKDLPSAKIEFARAYKKDSENFEANLYLGLAHLELKNKEAAKQHLLRAHMLRPRYVIPLVVFGHNNLTETLAELLEDSGDKKALLELAARAWEANTADAHIATVAAKIYFKEKDFHSALIWARRAMAVNPFDVDIQKIIMHSAFNIGDTSAEGASRAVLNLEPTNKAAKEILTRIGNK